MTLGYISKNIGGSYAITDGLFRTCKYLCDAEKNFYFEGRGRDEIFEFFTAFLSLLGTCKISL